MDHSVPACGLFDVIEHIEKDDEFLKEIKRLLRPDGRIYLTVPAYGWLWSEEDKYAGHFRRHTAGSLKRLLSVSGFTAEYVSYFFSLLPLPIFLGRTMPTYFGMRRRSDEATVSLAHGSRSSMIRSLAMLVFAPEVKAIRHGLPLPFGGSILAVAAPV